MLAPLNAKGPELPAGGQRIWVHFGLPPEVGAASNQFYSAFQISKDAEPQLVRVPMGGFDASVQLSEDAPNSQQASAYPNPRPEHTYAAAYPPVEYRILAAYKIWGAFHYFFAYRDLMDEDWDELLPQFLPRFIASKDAKEYNLTIAEMLTHVADSNVHAESDTLADYFGKAPVGLRLRLIEKHAVITEVLDPEARQAGVKIGDIVKTLDGETLVDRFKRQAQYVSASTTQSLGYSIITRILNGPDGSTAALSIEDRTGNRKQISLKRSSAYLDPLKTRRSTDVLHMLPGNIGYVDMERLQEEQIPQLIERFRGAKALVLDLRGLPANSAARLVAAHLSKEQQAPAAIVTGPLALSPDLQQGDKSSRSSSYFFVQTLPPSEPWKYLGRVIALIDERTTGAAERAALYLQAATKVDFIGTPSAGAESDTTNFTVPGGITVYFSGHDIRQATGGKLQRLGVQPSVTVTPSLDGIRAGKDEVLDKALEQISPKLAPAKPAADRALRSFLPSLLRNADGLLATNFLLN